MFYANKKYKIVKLAYNYECYFSMIYSTLGNAKKII